MPAKKKNTAKSASSKVTSSQSLKTSRSKKEEVIEEEGQSLLDKLRGKKAKWLVLGVAALALFIFLSNKYLIAAWVNNKPISKTELYSQLDKRYGKDMLEELIVARLIEDEASKKNILVSQQDLDAEIKKVEDQQGGADKLNQILVAQNISRDEFNKLVRLQLLRQKLFGGNVAVSDEEVDKYIEENKEQLDLASKTASEQAKLKNDIKEQLSTEKINEGFRTWLDEALKGPNVVRT